MLCSSASSLAVALAQGALVRLCALRSIIIDRSIDHVEPLAQVVDWHHCRIGRVQHEPPRVLAGRLQVSCALPSFGAGVRSVLNGIGTGGLGKHSGESMKPTLGSGLVLVRKFDYALPWFVPQLKHGDLVFFETPVTLNRFNIKRIIAMVRQACSELQAPHRTHSRASVCACVCVRHSRRTSACSTRIYMACATRCVCRVVACGSRATTRPCRSTAASMAHCP